MGREGPPGQLYLPPGFRFYPTDEELVEDYLCKKTAGHPFSVPIIAEVDLYRFDPWVLPEKALFGEKEWFFFSPRDRKYPNGSRPNRAAGSGYWKATGTDKPICSHSGGHKTLVGVKKALVFYIGKAPKGTKTNWIMHEYRLADASSRAAKRKGSLRLDDWVLCRIYKKTMGAQKAAAAAAAASKECNESSSCLDEVLASLPDIDDKQFINLPRLNSMNLFMEQKPSNTIEAKACADNVSRSCDDQPWMNANNNTNTTTTTTTNNNNHSVSFLMDLGQKADQQFSNGGTDGVVTEVASSRCNYTYPLDALHEFNNNPRRNVNINYDLATALPCRPPRPERQPLMHHQHDSPDHEEVQSTFRIHNNDINLLQPAQPQMGFGYNGSQVQNTFNASQMDPMNMVFDNAFLASLQGSSYMQPRSQ